MDDLIRNHIREAAGLLHQAERPIRILRTIAWPDEVKQQFFAARAQELPRVSYEPVDPTDTLATLEQARAVIATLSDPGRDTPQGVIAAWLQRQAHTVECAARMLAAVGTPEFTKYSIELYGEPGATLPDERNTSLGLARTVSEVVSQLAGVDLGAPAAACHLADSVADQLRAAVTAHFGDAAPLVEVVDSLSANALAGPRRIRLRRAACFTDRDAAQLIQHEAFIHVGTSLNGRAQADLPILGAGHAGTTRTQEGLAVFAEMISGVMDADRLRRLADRVLAIHMALEGADFIDVWRFFAERTGSEDQAFENARRVFRGGVVAGGAPFTKDGVYLDGLLRVHNFLRAIIAQGPIECMKLLFCGKLDIEDIPALAHLYAADMLRPALFLPPWASDLRFLVAYLAYSRFLNQIALDRVHDHYRDMLSEARTAIDHRDGRDGRTGHAFTLPPS